MIGISALFADTSAAQALCNRFIRNVNLDNLVDGNAHSVKSLRLRYSAGEAIQNEAVLAVILGDSVL